VPLQQHRAQVVMAILGDASSGKTSFVNALTEELSLLEERVSASLPAQWQVSEDFEGEWPSLLLRAAEQFPDWVQRAAATVKSCRHVPAQRLRGIEVIEVSGSLPQQDLEPTTWILSHTDIVVCMLDSQAKQPSEALLALLKKISSAQEPPELQFVFSRADLLRRESDRVQLIAKASRLLQESLGRRFEILPVATGDLAVLLDVLDDKSNKWDAGRCRALHSAQELLQQRVQDRLDLLRSDCKALRLALDMQKSISIQTPAQTSTGGNQLLLCGIGFALAAAVVPFVLDEDIDASMVPIFMACTLVLACFCLFLAFYQRSQTPEALPGESAMSSPMLMKEQERFLSLVEKQCEVWQRSSDRIPGTGS